MYQVLEAVSKGGTSRTKLSSVRHGVGDVSDPAAHIAKYRGLYPAAMGNAGRDQCLPVKC